VGSIVTGGRVCVGVAAGMWASSVRRMLILFGSRLLWSFLFSKFRITCFHMSFEQ
jgi:hypothetical protein